jgi:hypothetical protein
LPDLPYAHVGVTNNVRTVIRKSFSLYITRRLYACTNRFTRLAHPISSQRFVVHARNFYMNINPVQDGT